MKEWREQGRRGRDGERQLKCKKRAEERDGEEDMKEWRGRERIGREEERELKK